MHQSILLLALSSGISLVAAKPRPLLAVGANQVDGVATFNNYGTQGSTVCGPKAPGMAPQPIVWQPANNNFAADNSNYFGAAIGDISKDINGGQCDGSKLGDQTQYDMSLCSGQGSSTPGIGCPTPKATTCGLCFKVDNYGDISAPGPSILGNATVQIIDACPAGSAMNYCKTDTEGRQRCGDGTTNSLDIDQMAYKALTGNGYNDTNHPNLSIKITAVSC